MRPKVLGVIPARYRSTRFPGKPLALIAGKPMIQWVYERAKRAKLLDEVVVATDDRRIEKAVRGFGGKAVMTSARHPSGSDRIAEVARKTNAGIIVNIQGDEPLMDPGAIDKAIQALKGCAESALSTLAAAATPEGLFNPDVVKVVCDRKGYALYFSRAPIPYPREPNSLEGLQHIGLYAYRRGALLDLSKRPPGQLERKEKLEQLRALENSLKIKVVKIKKGWPSVDRPQDVGKVERFMERGKR